LLPADIRDKGILTETPFSTSTGKPVFDTGIVFNGTSVVDDKAALPYNNIRLAYSDRDRLRNWYELGEKLRMKLSDDYTICPDFFLLTTR
jgi:hypothetical protein